MNLTFGICWIEDQASDPERADVEAAVRSNGFEPEIHTVASADDIQAFAKRQHYFQDYDLILLDLRLGDGLRGDELAPQVRRRFRSTPILFYSAVREQDLRRSMADQGVDGVYCTNRRTLATRVRHLVSDLTPALNRLSGMRGIAARVVAECDEDFREILLHVGSRHDLEDEIVDSLKQALAGSQRKQLERVQATASLTELLAQPPISSGLLFDETNKRTRRLSRDSEELREARVAINEYATLVLRRRNILSHALEERTDSGWVIRGGALKPDLTVEDFPSYRADFLAHRRDIARLRSLLIDQ